MLSHEIIVADNGSEDNTIAVAKANNAVVIVDNNTTVGGLRNRAVNKAKGHVLVFLDADMFLTEQWGKNILAVYKSLSTNPQQVTGSRCGISEEPGWIERFWFKPLVNKPAKYINSGHLITTRYLFDSVGGFDERLESGEDYAFGRCAAAINATITNNPSLAVVHQGYPKTLIQFIRREIWHGCGESKTLRTVLTSNVAIASILFMSINLIFIVGFIFFRNPVIGVMGITTISGICIAFAVIKHGVTSIQSFAIVSMLYYFYFFSRFLSCIPIFCSGSSRKRDD